MTEHNETKIAVCPYCGGKPGYMSEVGNRVLHNPDPKQGPCRLSLIWFKVADWNALCADIERGQRYNEMQIKYIAAKGAYNTCRPLLNAAVRLLDEHVDDETCSYDHHGYCQTHRLGDKPCEMERTRIFLALAAITKIREQEGK